MYSARQLTLERLMHEVGCEQYPQQWGAFFEDAMEKYDAQGCFLAKLDYYEQLHEKYGCFDKYGEVYKKAAMQVTSDEMLGRFLVLFATALQDVEHKISYIYGVSQLVPPEGKERLGYTMATALVMCSQLEEAADKLKNKNIPQEMINDVLRQAINHVGDYERKHSGEKGFDLLWWVQAYIDGRIFLIERLEIELFSFFRGNAIVYENRSGQVVALAEDIALHRDGMALGCLHYRDNEGSWKASVEETEDSWIGYPYLQDGTVAHERIELCKDKWKKVLVKGDPVIRLHIPPTGKLTPESVDITLQRAKEFIQKYYPDFEYKAITCGSWIMDPQLDTLLGEKSNIVKFSKRFQAVTMKDGGEEVFDFIFDKPDMNFDITKLPENTSLERALKHHYLNGKAIYSMEGFFLRF